MSISRDYTCWAWPGDFRRQAHLGCTPHAAARPYAHHVKRNTLRMLAGELTARLREHRNIYPSDDALRVGLFNGHGVIAVREARGDFAGALPGQNRSVDSPTIGIRATPTAGRNCRVGTRHASIDAERPGHIAGNDVLHYRDARAAIYLSAGATRIRCSVRR